MMNTVHNFFLNYSDAGDVDDKFWMLVTEIRCWWPKCPKRLSTSQKCHEQISSPTFVTFRSSLNFFEIGNMIKIYLCKCISIDQKYSATFDLIAMCCQPIFSSQIYIPIDLIFKGKTPRKDSKSKKYLLCPICCWAWAQFWFQTWFWFYIFSGHIFSVYKCMNSGPFWSQASDEIKYTKFKVEQKLNK